ncbi:hypothetical protein KIN_40420 [Litoreibacter roseus]|uniref:Uncharacterized protein n=2 Tax=Litoreibacter roseus TaxID=2601869 RepID=A0A6N6JNH0_9RHOB|nr:hypothetical protein KIN_40420 [Litoreibacter roseus]
MVGLGFLVMSATGSAIAWQTWGDRGAQTSEPVEAVETVRFDIAPLERDLNALVQDNLALRAELEALSGRDGVLPRIIAQLQEGRRLDATYGAAIQQLLAGGLQLRDEPAGVGAYAATQQNLPVQVTPISVGTDQPQRVVVTPVTTSEGQGQ